ncbi:MAG: DinB family protein [Ferruginibacter sp.]
MTKPEIIQQTEKAFTQLSSTCKGIDEVAFFKRPDEKWSAAENVQHLIISTNASTLAWYLPLFLVRWIGGTPNRNSRTYDELKNKYYKKLSEGGRASNRFVPKPFEIKYGKKKLLDNWNKATAKFINTLTKNRSEKDLDSYLVKHPLLGRITLRELGYFTIFHTEHHLHSIQKAVENS